MKKLITATMITLTFAITGSINRTQAQTYFSYDFSGSGNFDFDYGTWTGQYTPGPSYITVSGTADNYGGAGKSFAPTDITLTPPANTYIVITARLLPSHGGGDIRLSLSSSGTDYSVWAAPASLFNTTTFTTVQIPISTPPVFTSGSLDLTAVFGYNIQGDFNSPGAFAVEIQSISIIPEPSTVALLATTVLLSGIVVARRRMNKYINKTPTA
jgi:hypothetical protein